MGQIPVRIISETESGKAYKAAVAVAPKRMAAALRQGGILEREIFIPKSSVAKSEDGLPKVDAKGSAMIDSWGLRGKIKDSDNVLVGGRAVAIIERAQEAAKVGCLSLVTETDDGLRVAAEAPDTQKGRQYVAFLARETGHPDAYRIIRTDQPVVFKAAAIINGKGEPQRIDAIGLDDLPAHTVCTVDEIAPPKAKAQTEPQAPEPTTDGIADGELAARAARVAGLPAQPPVPDAANTRGM